MLSKLKKSFISLKKKLKHGNVQHKPLIDSNDLVFLKKTIKFCEVSTYGRFSTKFEKQMGKYLKTKNIISTVNGTTALQSILSYLKVDSSQEVLVQSFTFVATVNPIIHLGGDPHFIDISKDSLSVDSEKLEEYLSSKKFYFKNKKLINRSTKKVIKILLITHSYGYPADIEKINKVAKKFNLILVEDAAETLGSKYKGKNLGTFGDFSFLSFNGNKTITTGGGGLIITKKSKHIKEIKHLITTSKIIKKKDIVYDQAGFNLRMPSLNAALGLSQLKKLKKILKLKNNLFQIYFNHFKKIDKVTIYNGFNHKCINNFWIFLLKINNSKIKKTHLISIANKLNLEIKKVWVPLHRMKYLKKYQTMNLDNTNYVYKYFLCLPSSPQN